MTGTEGEAFRRKVRNARHESVTSDLLGKEAGGVVDARLSDGALISHLFSYEQPHFIFRGEKRIPEVYGSITPSEFSRSRRYKVFHVVTDDRWLSVVGNRNGDQKLSIELESIGAVNYRQVETRGPNFTSRVKKWEIALETERGFVKIPVEGDLDKGDFAELGSYLSSKADVEVGDLPIDSDEAGYTVDGIETYSPSEKTIATLLDDVPPSAEDEANKIVSEAEDAGDLVRELKHLIENHETKQHSINDVVSEAEEADELRKQVASRSDKVRFHAERGLVEAQETIKEADPEEVSQFTVQTVSAAAPAIQAASRSHPMLFGSVLVASAIGARKSSDRQSVFDELDPHQLSATAQMMADQGGTIYEKEARGEAVGALLGLSTQALETMAPEDYAEWVTKADVGAVMEGAQMAAKMSEGSSDELGNLDYLAGGAFGLMYGYNEPSENEMTELLEPEDDIVR